MGASNVAAAYTWWSAMKDRPFRLLAYMALVTMDGDDPPRYWAGHEKLSEAIGRPMEPEPDGWDHTARAEAVRKRRKNDFEAVRVALRELVTAGVVTVLTPPGPGRRTVYGLMLAPATPRELPGEHPGVIPETPRGYPGERPGVTPATRNKRGGLGKPQGTTSPEGGTSPEEAYAEAWKYMNSLPDFGREFMTRYADLPPRAQVIAAYRAAREAS